MSLPTLISRSPNLAPGPSHLTRRRFLQTAGLSAAALGFYSCEFARHDLEITHIPLAIRRLPDPFHGFRIVQVSDIHLDDYTEPIFLRHALRAVNALNPDLVLITGDFITHGPPRHVPEQGIYTCAEALKAITCPQRIGCLGNHDSAVGADFIAGVLRENGTPILINQNLPIERDGKRLWIAGVEDPTTSYPDLAKAIPQFPDGPVVLLAHAPDYADHVAHNPYGRLVDLMLSGHSHGGQVRLPFVGPLVLPPLGRKYIQGHFHIGANLQLYVNRGLGSVGLPFRLNCRPEITAFTLQNA